MSHLDGVHGQELIDDGRGGRYSGRVA
jgi:hypothetical protein